MTSIREPARAFVVASLLLATYTVATCPCNVLVKCNQARFYTATIIPIAVVAFINANDLT